MSTTTHHTKHSRAPLCWRRPTTRMRYPLLAALTVFTAAERATAFSCEEPPWSQQAWGPLDSELLLVPVDVHPWRVEACAGGPPEIPQNCNFVAIEGKPKTLRVAAEVEVSNAAACRLEYYELPGDAPANVIVTFIPAEALSPGTTYRISCDETLDTYSGWGTVHVRGDSTPAAPPAATQLVDAEYQRGDDGCCEYGDYVEVTLDGLDAASLGEGGYIDVALASGQRFVTTLESGPIILPGVHDAISLTPVSASGVRGETINIDADMLDGPPVYLPCNVTSRPPPAALWLIAPFAWILVHGQRRRRLV